MATLASLMARGGSDQCQLFAVTALAHTRPRAFEHEVVRLVALCARCVAVKSLVGAGSLVTAAAVSNAVVSAGTSGMWIVAANAAAGDAVFRMIRMLVFVTRCARLIRRTAHIVRRMAARALRMLPDAGLAENDHALVARTARNGFRFLEFMGAMATDTFAVAVRE